MATADPKSERRLIELLLIKSRTGGHQSVADEAAKLVQKPTLDREVLVELAQCFSMAAASVSDAPLRQKYMEQGLDMLKRARQQGYKDLVVLETDPDLRLLREQPEFKRLIMATDEIAPDS